MFVIATLYGRTRALNKKMAAVLFKKRVNYIRLIIYNALVQNTAVPRPISKKMIGPSF